MESIILTTEEGKIQFSSQFSQMSNFVKHAIEDFPGEVQVQLPMPHLHLIKDYCEHHNYQIVRIERPVSGKPFEQVFKDPWDREFLERVKKSVTELLLSVVFLDVEGLLDLLFAFVAWEQTSLPFESIKKRFGITAEYTEEEDQRILQANPWSLNRKNNNQ
jgi:hypothetical protein